ncbi:MAG: flagellar brake domain-containing protein [Gallionella sp.]
MSHALQTGKLEVTDNLLSLPVRLGDAWQMRADDKTGTRQYAKLIGYVNHESLIVMLPGTQTLPDVGAGFLLRGFVGNKTYEFYSKVLSVSSIPYLYLHLTFPKQVSITHMRRAIRVRTYRPATASGMAGRAKEELLITELSGTGAGLRCVARLGGLGDYLTLNFTVLSESGEQPCCVAVVIRSIHEPVEGSKDFLYGVEFVAMTDSLRSALQEYLCVLLLDIGTPRSGFV